MTVVSYFKESHIFLIRVEVGVETVVVPGVLEVPVLGVDLEGVLLLLGVLGRGVWCVALWMEALYVVQSWRPKAAVRRAEEEEEGWRLSDLSEWMMYGCPNWSQGLSPAENVYIDPVTTQDMMKIRLNPCINAAHQFTTILVQKSHIPPGLYSKPAS